MIILLLFGFVCSTVIMKHRPTREYSHISENILVMSRDDQEIYFDLIEERLDSLNAIHQCWTLRNGKSLHVVGLKRDLGWRFLLFDSACKYFDKIVRHVIAKTPLSSEDVDLLQHLWVFRIRDQVRRGRSPALVRRLLLARLERRVLLAAVLTTLFMFAARKLQSLGVFLLFAISFLFLLLSYGQLLLSLLFG